MRDWIGGLWNERSLWTALTSLSLSPSSGNDVKDLHTSRFASLWIFFLDTLHAKNGSNGWHSFMFQLSASESFGQFLIFRLVLTDDSMSNCFFREVEQAEALPILIVELRSVAFSVLNV